MSKKRNQLEYRIRHTDNFMNDGEYFLFECKRSNEKDWGLDTAFKVMKTTDEDVVVNLGALVKISRLMDLDIPFKFC